MTRDPFTSCKIRQRSLLPTLLILPGTLCDARVWPDIRRLLRREWPCVFVDYRFETSIPAMATKALAQAAGSVIPIGHSMGGMVALEIWRQAPERVAAIAMFDTDPGADTPARRTKRDAQVNASAHGNFRDVIDSQLVPTYFSSMHSADAHLRKTVVAMALDQGARAYAAQATALATRPDAWPLFDRINVPTLIACGAQDRICLPQTHVQMAARLALALATFRTIADAGHFAPLEQPEAAMSVLRNWLDGLRSRNVHASPIPNE